MLTILAVDELPSEEEINNAEKIFFITMEAAKDYLVNNIAKTRNLYRVLVSMMYQSLIDHGNFPDDEGEVKEIIDFVFNEYLKKGMPDGKLKQDNDYYLLVFRIVMAMACDKQMVSLWKELNG